AYPGRLAAVAAAAGRPGARPHVAGAHLEGPFLGGRPGAHPAGHVRPADPAWIAALPPIVRIVTLGAEVAGAAEAIRAVTARRGLAAVGHSDATLAQARAAVDAGARLVTHGFNA